MKIDCTIPGIIQFIFQVGENILCLNYREYFIHMENDREKIQRKKKKNGIRLLFSFFLNKSFFGFFVKIHYDPPYI
jgi:hypothetical protein